MLLGDVGVGKTIFLRHLIDIDAAALLKNAVTLYIDFGSQANLTSDLHRFIVDEICRQLRDVYEINTEAYNFVRGVYYRELVDFREGVHGKLLNTNEPLFREKEAEFLEARIADHVNHLRRSLEHVSRGRGKQIVLFLDNCDQRGPAIQDELFLKSQEIAEHWPVLVFVPLRPETFHRSRRDGALTGYHPKAFTISPPAITKVLQKRLSFAIKLLDGTIALPALPGDASQRSADLELLLKCFLDSLERNRWLAECIENITGGNVRLALDITRGFFGSGHVDTPKIVRKARETGDYTVPLHEFLRAVIFGDCVHYSPELSPVANLFDICTLEPRDHFTMPVLLAFIRQAMRSEGRGSFVETDRVYEACQGFGFTPEQIDYAIVRGCRKRLLETIARISPEEKDANPRSMRITSIGMYHIGRLCGTFTYVDAMVIATPILDDAVREKVSDVTAIVDRLERAQLFRSYLDNQWSKAALAESPFEWHRISRALERDICRICDRVRGGM